MIFLDIETKTIDATQWNGMIFIVTTLITIFLGAIVYYARDTAKSQKEIVTNLHDLSMKLQHVSDNSDNTKSTVEKLYIRVEKIENKLNEHDNKFARLEVHK